MSAMTADRSTLAPDRVPALLRAMSNAQPHVHVEGSIDFELIFALAPAERKRERLARLDRSFAA